MALQDTPGPIDTRPAESPVQLRYRMRPGPGGTWQIADISYPGAQGFPLTSYLAELLGR